MPHPAWEACWPGGVCLGLVYAPRIAGRRERESFGAQRLPDRRQPEREHAVRLDDVCEGAGVAADVALLVDVPHHHLQHAVPGSGLTYS